MIVTLDKEKAEKFFQTDVHSAYIVLEIYKQLYGEHWKRIKKTLGNPSSSLNTFDWFMQKFIEHDKVYVPKNTPGAIWLWKGFQIDPNLDDWEIRLANYIDKNNIVVKL